jgi:hypothetical protein
MNACPVLIARAERSGFRPVGAELVIHVMRPGVFVYRPVEQVAMPDVRLRGRRRWW